MIPLAGLARKTGSQGKNGYGVGFACKPTLSRNPLAWGFVSLGSPARLAKKSNNWQTVSVAWPRCGQFAQWRTSTVAQFLYLSEACINLDTIRLVYPGMGKPDRGEGPRCMVTFVGSSEPHGFYGKDAESLLNYLRDHARGATKGD